MYFKEAPTVDEDLHNRKTRWAEHLVEMVEGVDPEEIQIVEELFDDDFLLQHTQVTEEEFKETFQEEGSQEFISYLPRSFVDLREPQEQDSLFYTFLRRLFKQLR